ncbi:MAG: cyclic nucleotide-binding domain-containing protein [Acidimicrobiales bacterium]
MDRQLLAGIPLFDGMSEEEVQDCAGAFQQSQVLMGQEVTTQDDFGYSFFVVLSGRVRIDIDNSSVVELSAGDHFGEVSLVTGEKRNATVKALETCQLAKMMTWDFQELRKRNASFESRIQAAIADRS